MGALKTHGVSSTTPSSILFGAGTYYKNLTFSGSAWSGDILGATSGGGKVSIVGEFVKIEADGVLVNGKGLTVKQGGAASMEVNFIEVTTDILKMANIMEEGTSEADGYTMLQDKAVISEGDYLENVGFVGKTADGTKTIIVIFDYALCTSGLEIEGKNKENAVIKATLEAYADLDGDLDRLPVRIYYPEAATL